MISNRSVPSKTVLPHVVYQDVARTVDWLTTRFGFVEHYRYGDPSTPGGAQMRFGDVYIMLSAARPGRSSPAQAGGTFTQMLTLFVEDVDAYYARAKAADLTIFEEINETFYGERQYGVEDIEGHRWLFSQHMRDVDPSEWGAAICHS